MHYIVVLADIHVGHVAALWPKDFATKKGNVLKRNRVQEVLGNYWEDFWSQPEVRKAEYVLNLAESIEGYSPREHGVEDIMTTSLAEQIRAFRQLLEPKIRGKIYISVEGSRYHGSRDNRIERLITQELKGGQREYLGYIGNWIHKPTGKRFLLTHKLGTPVQYKVALMDKWSLYLSAIKSKIKTDFDAVVSAHHHQFFGELTPTRTIIMCPSWKNWHTIKDASRYPYSQPTIGGLVLCIDKKDISLRRYFYPLEHLEDAEVIL